MKSSFQKKWQEIVSRKNTTIIAGLDPSEEILEKHGMYKNERGEYNESQVLEWCLKYIEEVSPHVAGIKLNPNFFSLRFFNKIDDSDIEQETTKKCKELGLISIRDRKHNEIGNTNEKSIKSSFDLGYDAITIFPILGKDEIDINYVRNFSGKGVFNMGVMSDDDFIKGNTEHRNMKGETLIETRTRLSLEVGVDGLVLGANYSKIHPNFTTVREFLKQTRESNCLFLCPGIGAQGGDPEVFLSAMSELDINPGRFMLSSSRDLMNAENRSEMARTLKEKYQKVQREYDRELKKLNEVNKQIK